MKKQIILAAFVSALTSAVPASAEGIPKFGNTCVGNFGKSTNICISSNGSFVSSSYTFRGSIATKGTHKGCSAKGDTIVCTGGVYKTNQGNGDLTRVVIDMKNGKPAAMAWR